MDTYKKGCIFKTNSQFPDLDELDAKPTKKEAWELMPKGKTDDQFPDLDAFDSKPMKNKEQMSEHKKYEKE